MKEGREGNIERLLTKTSCVMLASLTPERALCSGMCTRFWLERAEQSCRIPAVQRVLMSGKEAAPPPSAAPLCPAPPPAPNPDVNDTITPKPPPGCQPALLVFPSLSCWVFSREAAGDELWSVQPHTCTGRGRGLGAGCMEHMGDPRAHFHLLGLH